MRKTLCGVGGRCAFGVQRRPAESRRPLTCPPNTRSPRALGSSPRFPFLLPLLQADGGGGGGAGGDSSIFFDASKRAAYSPSAGFKKLYRRLRATHDVHM